MLFAIAAREARLAADADAYLAQLTQGLAPWQVERLLTRVPAT
ncbi:MAG: hypothetical protein U1E76_04345 [Planctomycetota bacterium]